MLDPMKTSLFCIVIAVLSLSVSAQTNIQQKPDSNTEPALEKKVDYTFSTGTSFFTSPGHANGSSFYLAPEFKFKVSPKFKVNAGVMLMQNRFNLYTMPSMANTSSERSVVLKSGPSTDGVAYASGNYEVNPRLSFSGSVVSTFSPGGYSSQNAAWQNSFQSMSFGVNYKLSEHMSIGGGVHVIQSNGFSPYNGYNYMNTGFGGNPMNPFSF